MSFGRTLPRYNAIGESLKFSLVQQRRTSIPRSEPISGAHFRECRILYDDLNVSLFLLPFSLLTVTFVPTYLPGTRSFTSVTSVPRLSRTSPFDLCTVSKCLYGSNLTQGPRLFDSILPSASSLMILVDPFGSFLHSSL